MKIATSNQIPGNFDIIVNSVYRNVQKIVFKLTVAWIEFFIMPMFRNKILKDFS